MLNQLSINLSHYEQLDFVRRAHMAEKMLIYMSMDLRIKERFYTQIQTHPSMQYSKLRVLTQLLQNRLVNSELLLEKSRNLI